MARKVIVKVVLSKEQKEILTELKNRLGTSESETMRLSLMDYIKDAGMIKEIIQQKNKNKDNPEK